MDRDGNMLHLNAALETMVGYRPDEVVGRPFLTWVAEDALEEGERQYRTWVESAEEAIGVLDERGHLLFANRRITKQFD